MAHGSAVWLPFVQPFGTVLLGIGAAFIAYRQWRTANNKVRVDLFDKRLAEYAETMKIFDNLSLRGGLSEKDIKNATILERRSKLFFGSAYVASLSKSTAKIEHVLLALAARDEAKAALIIDEIRAENKKMFNAFAKDASVAKIR